MRFKMAELENKEVLEESSPEVVSEAKVENTPKSAEKTPKKDKKKDKKPKERKVARKVKETTSELKKVSWLSFGQVCKRTGIVVGFVLLSALVLFGIDKLLSLLYELIINSIKSV